MRVRYLFNTGIYTCAFFYVSFNNSRLCQVLKLICAISKKRTGIDFVELHEWIDGPTRSLGADHRRKRHYYTKNIKNKVKKYWEEKGEGLGEKAVIEWLLLYNT